MNGLTDKQAISDIVIFLSVAIQIFTIEVDQFVTVQPEGQGGTPGPLFILNINAADSRLNAPVLHFAHRGIHTAETCHNRDRTGKDLVVCFGEIDIEVYKQTAVEPCRFETDIPCFRCLPTQVCITDRTLVDPVGRFSGVIERIIYASRLAVTYF